MNEKANTKTSAGMVFCFGELLLRMSPALGKQWIKQARMPVYIGGAELNVATALAKWNIPVSYCTALPLNYLSAEIIEEIEQRGVKVSAIRLAGDRIGLYYLPQGTDLKHAGVIYDRAHSSFADLQPGMIDWDSVLEGCGWFHFSAISPALNRNVAAVCKEGIEKARAKGLSVSVDLNYRARLWQYGIKPSEIMPELVRHCQVIMGNIWSAEALLGIESTIKESAGRSKRELVDAAGKSMLALHRQYPMAGSFAYTFRLEKEYWAILRHGAENAVSKEFPIGEVIDKVGSGDCFMAGLLYGLYQKRPVQELVDFAAAAAIGKLQELGDATSQTIQDVQKRIEQKK